MKQEYFELPQTPAYRITDIWKDNGGTNVFWFFMNSYHDVVMIRFVHNNKAKHDYTQTFDDMVLNMKIKGLEGSLAFKEKFASSEKKDDTSDKELAKTVYRWCQERFEYYDKREGYDTGDKYDHEVFEDAAEHFGVSWDEAKKLYDPQNAIFERIKEAAGEDILKSDGSLDKKRFAARLFEDNDLRERVNSIVHPAMESIILDNMALERSEGKRDFFFVEAALLVECGYDRILDELWYVYASEETRRKRLKDTRGYSDEKIRGIFDSQISEKEYREHCARVIDNDGSMQTMHASVDKILKEVSNRR